MTIRAVIFDLDMTLVDSRRDIAGAMIRSIHTVCGRDVTEAQAASLIGRPLTWMIAQLAPDATPEQITRAAELYKRDFYEHCCDQTRPFPGVVETLQEIAGRGLSCAVATTKMTYMARHVCGGLGLDRHLQHIQGTDGFPAKPDPAVILQACAALGVAANEALAVGDTVHDVEAARRAGAKIVAATYGIGTPAELRQAQPDGLIAAFPGILSYL